MNPLLKSLKNNLTINSNYFRYAIRLVISCSLTVFLYEFLHLKNGYWAAFSVIACVWPTQGQSLQRASQRVLGTFLGMGVGIVVAHSFGRNLILVDILLPIFIFLTFYLRAYTYSLYVLFTTVLTVLFICLIIPGDWQVAIVRLAMTLLGTMIALLATIFILPSRASSLLPLHLETVQQDIEQYYAAICQSYGKPPTSALRARQLRAFKNLQVALNMVQEATFEYTDLSKQYHEQSQLYQSLETLYQNLLTLEIHVPEKITQGNLQPLSQSLANLLYKATPLFSHSNTETWMELNDQLAAILTEIRRQRSAAAVDLRIQTATFYEHIQLNIFIEALRKFFTNLRSLPINHK